MQLVNQDKVWDQVQDGWHDQRHDVESEKQVPPWKFEACKSIGCHGIEDQTCKDNGGRYDEGVSEIQQKIQLLDIAALDDDFIHIDQPKDSFEGIESEMNRQETGRIP